MPGVPGMPNVDFDAIAEGMAMAVPFLGHLNVEIVEIAAGEATVRLPGRPELANHVGTQHAGALFTAAEAASGGAFVGAFAIRMGDITPLARRAEIEYVKVANGPITATAKLGVDAAEALATLDAEGKVEFPCEVELSDAKGNLVATATVEWHVRLKKA
jgi:acyl-coenzyme A thioesterase PaaI-like protein